MPTLKDFTVTQIVRSTRLDPRSQPVPTYLIRFRVLDQTEDQVEIPESEYTADAVRKMILEKVAKHKEVLGL